MRRLIPLVLLLVFVSTAAAATVRGTKRADFIQTAFGGTDRVVCGRGADVVSADATDKVAADCEVVSRRLSIDPYANGDSQHETAVEPDDFAYGGVVVAAYQVGRRENGAAANIGTSVSRDGGRTWQRSLLPGITVNAGGSQNAVSDPSVAYDATHGVWLVGSLTLQAGAGSHVAVSTAADGLHWGSPVNIANGGTLDKGWITCDNNAGSAFKGRCYAEYTDDDANSTVSQSSDDGGATWSAPVRVTGFSVGTQPIVQPNGTVVVVTAGNFPNDEAASGTVVALRSSDGGRSWQRSTVSDFTSASNLPMRAIPLPSADVDAAGTIYAAWHDCRFRAGCTGNDIVISTSTDGATWSAPLRVTRGFSSMIPGLGADQATAGRLGLVYAYFDAKKALNIAFVQSRDGGRTWTKTQRLNAAPMQMTWLPRAGGRMVGDYFSTAFVGGRVVPVYALAAPPLGGRFREGIFATSLKALP